MQLPNTYTISSPISNNLYSSRHVGVSESCRSLPGLVEKYAVNNRTDGCDNQATPEMPATPNNEHQLPAAAAAGQRPAPGTDL